MIDRQGDIGGSGFGRSRFFMLCGVAALGLSAFTATAQSGFMIGGPGKPPEGQRPAYLAARDWIDRPILEGGFFGIVGLLARKLHPGEDGTAALADEFLRLCVPPSLAEKSAGPEIDVDLLDPVSPPRSDGAIPILHGETFCVSSEGADLKDRAALAQWIAASPAMINRAGAYVTRLPQWCGGMSIGSPAPTPRSITVSALAGAPGKSRTGQHCWATGKVADYDQTVVRLQTALSTGRDIFRPDPVVADGSILRQTAFVQDIDGVARTILVSGRKSNRLNGPDVEIHMMIGRFSEPASAASAEIARD